MSNSRSATAGPATSVARGVFAGSCEKTRVDDAIAVVYDELHSLAAAYLRRESSELMLEPASLVHEAYLRLKKSPDLRWKNKGHFLAVSAIAMRRVLIDHARQRRALRRELSHSHVSVELFTASGMREVDILEVDDALNRMSQIHPRWGQVVELRFFAGLTHPQIARILSLSRKTVVEDWAAARAWLAEALSDSTEKHSSPTR